MAKHAAQIAAALLALAASTGHLQASVPDLRPELDPTGRIEGLAVSPSGQLWFGTATGHAYASFDFNRSIVFFDRDLASAQLGRVRSDGGGAPEDAAETRPGRDLGSNTFESRLAHHRGGAAP